MKATEVTIGRPIAKLPQGINAKPRFGIITSEVFYKVDRGGKRNPFCMVCFSGSTRDEEVALTVLKLHTQNSEQANFKN